MKRVAWVITAVLPSAVLMPGVASAHVGTGLAGGFVAGLEHPLTGTDHMLAMVAVGLWGAFLGRPLIYALPVIFPGMMVCGAIVAMVGLPLPYVDLGIAFSVLILGACIGGALRPPVWVACGIVAMFALFHGYAHGKELPSAGDPIGYSAGFVLATGTLHLAGISLGLINTMRGGTVLARTLGTMIAVSGVWFLGLAILR